MSNTSTESVWLKNPAGVKVALPPSLAAERLKQVGYSLCEADYVSAQKQYPMDGELTEEGEKRRGHRQMREREPIIAASAPAQALAIAVEPTDASTLLSPAAYRELGWMELKRYAGLRGIDTMQAGMTKEKVLSLLDVAASKMQG